MKQSTRVKRLRKLQAKLSDEYDRHWRVERVLEDKIRELREEPGCTHTELDGKRAGFLLNLSSGPYRSCPYCFAVST